MFKTLFKYLFRFCFVIFIILIQLGVVAFDLGYKYFSSNLPDVSALKNYQMKAATEIYSQDGVKLAERYLERRYPVSIKLVPAHVRLAFLASEDADFYKHPGIDFISILRALYTNFKTGKSSQGGSTITQQVVKNMLLTSEKKLARKIKEAILAFRIENNLSKDKILELYLNQIFFGNTAYGIQAAARVYFHKNVQDITIAEAALLAGLPQAPSRYSPISRYDLAEKRQRYVLQQMRNYNFINKQEYQEAISQQLTIYPVNRQKIFTAHYFVSDVFRELEKRWPEYDLDTAGLKIYASINIETQSAAEAALRQGILDTEKRRGWIGPLVRNITYADYKNKFQTDFSDPLESAEIYPAYIDQLKGTDVFFRLGSCRAKFKASDFAWAKKTIDENDQIRWLKSSHLFNAGDVIEVSADFEQQLDCNFDNPAADLPDIFRLSQSPKLQGALLMLNPQNGLVEASVGGFDYLDSQFNRATQSKRQPGSAFKPFVYLAAIDAFEYTPATVVYDEPKIFKVGDDYWEPQNFDEKFLGPISLRFALQQSRNLVSADLIDRIGVDSVIKYARALGVESSLGKNLSLSLGSSEVSLLELVRAYGVFAAKGYYVPTSFIEKIEDAQGKELYNYKNFIARNAKKVIRPQAAFVMANMMKGVVQYGTGWRLRELKRPIAGKTGTSNDQMDAWFIGYTPRIAFGVWVGFDEKKEIGKKETGGSTASPICLDFLKRYYKNTEEGQGANVKKLLEKEAAELEVKFIPKQNASELDFLPPSGLEIRWVEQQTGQIVDREYPNSIKEYFIEGTVPSQQYLNIEESVNYWDIPE